MAIRNPKWHQDEIILALDLYFSRTRGSIDAKNPKIIELSKILNTLPLFYDKPNEEKFRNANGVTLKLSNFLAIDPSYDGKGMTGGSKLDEAIFNQFVNKQDQLRAVAAEIRRVTSDEQWKKKVGEIEDDDLAFTDSVTEGQILYKLHKVFERDRKIVQRKKEQALARFGKLACEACVFVFDEFYGDIGKDFMECHHRTPLSKLRISTKTTLDSLALVCSNCHRMLHKRIDTISVEDLRMMIKYGR